MASTWLNRNERRRRSLAGARSRDELLEPYLGRLERGALVSCCFFLYSYFSRV